MTRRALAIGGRVAALVAVAALLWLFVRELAWQDLADALGDAQLWPLAGAVAISFAMLWCHAFALRVMLAPPHDVPLARMFRYTIVAYAGSVIAPVRAGEVLRVWLLERRDGVPYADSAAAVVGQKVVEAVTMMLFVAPVPWLVPDLPAWVARAIVVGVAVALALFAALYVVVGRGHPGAEATWWSRFLAGMHAVRDPRRLWRVAAAQLAAWLLDLGMVSLVLYAAHVALPVAAGLLILFTLNLSIIVPTPAHVGSLEVGVFAATRLLGVPDDRALAFALLYHASLVVPILAAGLALEMRVLLGREPVTESASSPRA